MYKENISDVIDYISLTENFDDDELRMKEDRINDLTFLISQLKKYCSEFQPKESSIEESLKQSFCLYIKLFESLVITARKTIININKEKIKYQENEINDMIKKTI